MLGVGGLNSCSVARRLENGGGGRVCVPQDACDGLYTDAIRGQAT